MNVKDGVVSVEFLNGQTILGFTGDGVFPPCGLEYCKFSFEAKTQGDAGLVAVFADGKLYCYEYYYDKGKLFAENGTKKMGKRSYSISTSLGLLTQADGVVYVTGQPENPMFRSSQTDKDNYGNKINEIPAGYKLVDYKLMLQYIDGTISAEDLAKNAQALRERKDRIEHLESIIKTAISLPEAFKELVKAQKGKPF